MPKVTLNKSELQKEMEKLQLYKRLLPSLDLKRRQLTLELNRAKDKLGKEQDALQELMQKTVEQIPMLANREESFVGIVKLESVQVGEQNVVGVNVPVLEEVTWNVSEYSLLVEPSWVDTMVKKIREVGELRLSIHVEKERVKRLERANRRITQRINLFEKILIPEAKENIRRIRIFLGDAEMAAVVRSKIAKSIHEKKREKLRKAS